MKNEPTFERSLERLAEVVEALESDGTQLAEAMKLYEEGILLAQSCRRDLEQAELRVTELKSRADGSLAEEDLDF